VGPNQIYEFPHFPLTPSIEHYIDGVAAAPHASAFDANRFRRCLGDAWLDYLAPFLDGRRPVLKYPGVADLESTFRYFPEAQLLLLVRDGRDVVASGLASGFVAPARFSLRRPSSWRRLIGPSDFRWLCRAYARAGRELAAFQSALGGQPLAGQVRRLRYEELRRSLRGQVEALLAWAGLRQDRFEWSRLEDLPVRGSSFGDDGQPGTPRWRDWSAGQRRTFELEAGDVMVGLGYRMAWDASPES
jgi:hypothetical protein